MCGIDTDVCHGNITFAIQPKATLDAQVASSPLEMPARGAGYANGIDGATVLAISAPISFQRA